MLQIVALADPPESFRSSLSGLQAPFLLIPRKLAHFELLAVPFPLYALPLYLPLYLPSPSPALPAPSPDLPFSPPLPTSRRLPVLPHLLALLLPGRPSESFRGYVAVAAAVVAVHRRRLPGRRRRRRGPSPRDPLRPAARGSR